MGELVKHDTASHTALLYCQKFGDGRPDDYHVYIAICDVQYIEQRDFEADAPTP
jgi:hypothetical protein